jgi:hypothetical protein
MERHLPVLGRSFLEGIELPQARSQLEIGFAGIAFGLEGKLRFQYRLQGTGQDWSVPATARSVNYGSLSAGRYRFQVRAVSRGGRGQCTAGRWWRSPFCRRSGCGGGSCPSPV